MPLVANDLSLESDVICLFSICLLFYLLFLFYLIILGKSTSSIVVCTVQKPTQLFAMYNLWFVCVSWYLIVWVSELWLLYSHLLATPLHFWRWKQWFVWWRIDFPDLKKKPQIIIHQQCGATHWSARRTLDGRIMGKHVFVIMTDTK